MSPPPPRKRRGAILLRLLRAAAGWRETRSAALDARWLPPMRGRVEIARDARGVPHVYAEHERDAYAALGFLQGADRFFLLDAIRQIGAARLCTWVGDWSAPSGTEELFSGRRVSDVDAFVRALDFAARSAADFERMEGPAREAVEAFAAGINAALAALDGVYPPEYLFVGAVQPWRPSDCLLAARTSGFIVSIINLDNELTFDAVRAECGDALARRLFPEAPWSRVPAIERHGTGSEPEPPFHLPAAGSNNWAVGSSRSASGAPVVANDPHVPLVPLPTYWYHAHLEVPGYRVQGGCFPGYPAFGFGHNGHLAWGCTTAFRDCWDLARIHRLPDDPRRYRTLDGVGEIRRHRETLRTRGGRAVDLEWESCEHGVIYPDWRHDDGADLALRQVPADAGRYLAGYRELAAARSVDAHRAALAEIHEGPFDFNHVYAHRDGHFGWEVFGRVPRRPADGLFVRDAHDPDARWDGWVPFEEMPKQLNPGCGYVASANSIVDPDQADLVATPAHYEPRYRQERIERALAAHDAHSVESFRALQADVGCDYAGPVRDALVGLLARFADEDSREGRALATLRAWAGDFPVDSAGALIFVFTQQALMRRVFLPIVGSRAGPRYVGGRRALPRLQRLLLDPDDPLRADVERAAERSLGELAADAFRAALDRTSALCGGEPGWRWGRVQRARLGGVLAELPRLGDRLCALDAPFPGDDYTVSPSRPLDEGHRLRAFVGASSRFVCDLARPDEAWFAHSSGPHGDPASAFHANLSAGWSRFELFRSCLWPADEVPDVVERVVVAGPAEPGA
ncbi:MAG: penicillin acylase family protein [Myxococcota bacterium]|nr:penicillin acylase family protein [Myxococcota bacterium]